MPYELETTEGTFPFENILDAIEHAETLKEENTVWDVSGDIPIKACTVRPE